jgi:Fe(3+) dicitrate transport protein
MNPSILQIAATLLLVVAEPGAETPAAPPAGAAPVTSLGEKVVVGRRGVDVSRVAGSANVVNGEELERFEHDDVHRILQQVPGVYLRDEDGYGLRPNIGLRGASSDRSSKVTLMEDGILFAPAPYSAPAAYYFPLMTRMAAVDVYKGPASIRFGPNTIGGALDLRTRDVPYQQGAGAIDLAGGSYRNAKVHAHAGAGGERWGWLLEGVHLQSDGFKDLDGGGDTGFDKNEAVLKLRYGADTALDEGHGLELKLGYADERSDETYLGLTDADFRATPLRRYAASRRDRMEWWRTQVQLTYAFERGDLGLRATAYRHDLDRAWTKLNEFRSGPGLSEILANPIGQNAVLAAILAGREDSQGLDQSLMVGTNDRRFVSQGVQVSGRWRLEGSAVDQRVDFGLRLHHDSIERNHDQDGFQMRSGVLVPDGTPTDVTVANTASTNAFAAHVQDEITFGRFLIVPGGRLELIQTRFVDRLADGPERTTFDAVALLGLGAVYQLTREVSLLAGAHQGFSPVSPGQSDGVDPERSVNYEAGVRLAAPSVKAEVIGFFNDYFNLVAECTFSAGCGDEQLNQQFNAGAVHVYGLEASVSVGEARLPLGLRLGAEAAYTLTLSEFQSSFASAAPQLGEVEEGDELPYVPRHQGALRLRLSRAPFSIAAAATYVSEMRETAGQGTPAPGDRTEDHLVVDLALHAAVGEASELYATTTNLLDDRHIAARRPFGARPGAPRQVMVGFKRRFQ